MTATMAPASGWSFPLTAAIVHRIFALTCLDSLILCFASLKEALAQIPAAANQRRDARGSDAGQRQTGS